MGKAPVFQSLFHKVAGLQSYNYIKKRTLTQVFPSEYWVIFKNTAYFEKQLRTTASGSCK